MKCKYPVYVFKWNEEISLETTEEMKKYKHSMPPRVVQLLPSLEDAIRLQNAREKQQEITDDDNG